MACWRPMLEKANGYSVDLHPLHEMKRYHAVEKSVQAHCWVHLNAHAQWACL